MIGREAETPSVGSHQSCVRQARRQTWVTGAGCTGLWLPRGRGGGTQGRRDPWLWPRPGSSESWLVATGPSAQAVCGAGRSRRSGLAGPQALSLLEARLLTPRAPGPASGSQPQTAHEETSFAKRPCSVLAAGWGAGWPRPRKGGSHRWPRSQPSHATLPPPHLQAWARPRQPASSHPSLGPSPSISLHQPPLAPCGPPIPRCRPPRLLPWGRPPSPHRPLPPLCFLLL